MTPETLMQPRYKVVMDYPENPFIVGSILTIDNDSVFITLNGDYYFSDKFPAAMVSSYYVDKILNIKKFPDIFNLLNWWQDRNAEELPKFVKCKNKIYKVACTGESTSSFTDYGVYVLDNFGKLNNVYGDSISFLEYSQDLFPANEDEYKTLQHLY